MTSLEFIEELAKEAHKHCPPDHPAGEHDYTAHRFTSTQYAKFFYDKTYSPKNIVEGIIAVAGDPAKGEWTRHPSPESVEEYLNDS